jgi:drug/metabolite transporter (DMT)-like permease
MNGNPALLKGSIFAFVTVSIWSGWLIISRMGMLSSLSSFDLTFLRYTTAGLIMLPTAIKNFHLINKDNWKAIALMVLCAGAPYLLVCNMGFKNAPASHGIITPSTMPLWVAIGAYLLDKQKVGAARLCGYLFIIAGVVFKLSTSKHGLASSDLFFLSGAVLWATYTLQAKRHNYLSALVTTSFVASGTMILIAIPYGIYQIADPHPLPLLEASKQIIYQGILVGVISLITYNRAMQLIGASEAASFAAFVPVMATLLAIVFLQEIPSRNDWILVLLMSVGVFLASGVARPIALKFIATLSLNK